MILKSVNFKLLKSISYRIKLKKYENMSRSWKTISKNETQRTVLYESAYSFGSKYKHENRWHTTKIGVYIRLYTWHISCFNT